MLYGVSQRNIPLAQSSTSASLLQYLVNLCLVTHPENNKPQIEQWINTWITLPVEFYGQSKLWGFVPPVLSSDVGYNPISLRVGDFNLDGYPDLLGVIKNTSSKGVTIQQAVLFENIPCSGPNCAGSERTFRIDFNTQLHPQSQMAIIPAFFDYLEDGVLDILVTTQSKDKGLHVHLLQQDFTDDACFLKVMVVSGLCFDDCPSNREPYGVNQWGPVVRYSTLNTNGKMQTALASQLTQSAYCPMQLPFTVFGLGQTPNFIENFEVGIPHPLSEAPRHKSWTSIIPNSQLIIIPYPNNKPSSWVNKLFVTPSRLVLLTGAALLGTCGFIAGIVGILHWREKVEDKREKLQEAHKFHFDAM
ncbi:hypothetical protein FSP39_011271 [Pinctada imbricata]|uniref:T-cell immunomodulatory protein TIP C2 domain-containing protein n=1 Tax=Pinctada imbricata TaxID=66713 RepID=A0AA88XIG8_PINIB|nr:hypothetical protein FSP39_011271 [Pinctada imbricata]